jgi:hypothetical protein
VSTGVACGGGGILGGAQAGTCARKKKGERKRVLYCAGRSLRGRKKAAEGRVPTGT